MDHGIGIVAHHVEGENHIIGVERFAIIPLDARAQLQGDLGVLGVVFPTFGQPVLIFTGEHVEHDQRFVHRGQGAGVESLIRAGDKGILIVKLGVLVGATGHYHQCLLARHFLNIGRIGSRCGFGGCCRGIATLGRRGGRRGAGG